MLGNLINQNLIGINESTLNLLIGIGIVAAFVTVVWQVSRKQANTENSITNTNTTLNEFKESINKSISESHKDLLEKITELDKEMTKKLADTKIERSEQIGVVQKQVNSMCSDLKEVGNRVTVVNTKVEVQEKEQNKLHERIDKNLGFITNWNQRIEDKVENSKRDLMGFMNMLINFSNRTKGRSPSA